jgi:nucleotide-binding universal stress UspA family protein
MGTQGASGADFLGSNAGAVVKHSRIPVLVVPGRSSQGPVRRILFADDEREMEPRDLRMLLDVARRTRAEVLLTHVLTDLEEVPDEALVAEYGELFRDIPHRFTTGEGKDVAAAIDLLADREGADMVAVMHRHTGFLEGLFHVSTAKRLALHTHIPLLVLQKDRN